MRYLMLGVFCVFSSVSQADSTSTTWVCTSPSGHKSIQDRPCNDGGREIPTVHHDQTFTEFLGNQSNQIQRDGERTRCRLLRESSSVVDRRKAVESCRGIQ